MNTFESILENKYSKLNLASYKALEILVIQVLEACIDAGVVFKPVETIMKIKKFYYRSLVIKALKNVDGYIHLFEDEYQELLINFEETLPPFDVGDSEFAAFYEPNEPEMWRYISDSLFHRTEQYKKTFKTIFVKHWIKQEFDLPEEIFEVIYEQAVADATEFFVDGDYALTEYDYTEMRRHFQRLYNFYNRLRNVE